MPFRATESLSKKVDRIEDELKWTNHSIESLSKKIDNKTNKIEESLEWLNWMKDHLHIDGVIEELAEKLEQKMEEFDEDDGPIFSFQNSTPSSMRASSTRIFLYSCHCNLFSEGLDIRSIILLFGL